jgi:hypothetical protein
VRNEERHLQEWLAWHFWLGFDSIFLLDNASTDATASTARSFSLHYDLKLLSYPSRAENFQTTVYELTARAAAGEYDWLAFFDANEFLVLDDGKDLKTLLSARPEAAIGLNWRIFGSSVQVETPKRLVTEHYTNRSSPDFPPNRHVKSIIRPSRMRSCLNPHVFEMAGYYVDLAGSPLTWQDTAGYLDHTPTYPSASLHRYFTRPWSQGQARLQIDHQAITRNEAECWDISCNKEQDLSAARAAPYIRAILARISTPVHRFSICACARWESDYIVEWLTYYRALGYDHVYLYCNDDDPADLYLRSLPFIQSNFVTFYHHAAQGEQFEMYCHFLTHHRDETAWISFFDIDEFLRLPPGETISDFTARFPGIDCILFNWIFFGTNGHETPPPGAVLENFTRRELEIHPLTKFIARATVFDHLDICDRDATHAFWHEPVTKVTQKISGVNVLGEDLAIYPEGFSSGASRAFLNEPARRDAILSAAVLHHYAFRSEQAFRDRAARGLGGDFAGQVIWLEHAEAPHFRGLLGHFNAVQDDALANFWDLLGAGCPRNSTNLASPASTRLHLKSLALSSQYPALPNIIQCLGDDGWQIDLERFSIITAIKISIQPGPDAPRTVQLCVSLDGKSWVALVDETGLKSFTWSGPGTAFARFARLSSNGSGSLVVSVFDVECKAT